MRLRTHRLLGTLGYATIGGVALVVGAVGVLIAPATTVGGAMLGVVVGVLVSLLAPRSTAAAKWAVLASRRHLGLLAGGATTATWVVVTGAVFLLGPAGSIILAALLLTGLPAIWLWRRFGAAAPDAPPGMPTPAAAQPPRFTPRPDVHIRALRGLAAQLLGPARRTRLREPLRHGAHAADHAR